MAEDASVARRLRVGFPSVCCHSALETLQGVASPARCASFHLEERVKECAIDIWCSAEVFEEAYLWDRHGYQKGRCPQSVQGGSSLLVQ